MCGVHGAGYAAREARGERKRSGRPVAHARYSAIPSASFAEVQDQISQLEDILTNSDRDLIALKAAEVYLLGQLEAHAPQVEKVNAELERLVEEGGAITAGQVTPEEAMRFVRDVAALARPVARLKSLVAQTTGTSEKVLKAHETRAATQAKLAEQQGLEVFLELFAVKRSLIHELAGDDQNFKDAFDDTARRRIFGPRHLELPALVELEYPVQAEALMWASGSLPS